MSLVTQPGRQGRELGTVHGSRRDGVLKGTPARVEDTEQEPQKAVV